MNHIVKIFFNDDGDKQDSPKWHLVQDHADSPRTVCTGEVFGEGEGSAVFEEKKVPKGGITCERCIALIKWYKAVKL